MKKFLICIVAALLIMPFALAEDTYPDGIYRGFYYDGGIEQLSIQFEMKDGQFRSIVFRGVRYKDGDYMDRDASDAQKATLEQYNQLADHLIGRGVEAIDDLYTPYDFVEDVDSVTSATIQSSKLVSAIWDGLNRHPYKLVDTTKLPAAPSYDNGLYRGGYAEKDGGQIEVHFTLKDNVIVSAEYALLQYEGLDYLSGSAETAPVREQFEQLLRYLVGKDVSAVNDLYLPGNVVEDVDTYSGATLRSPKLISAIWDGLGRHAYRMDQ